MAPAPSTLSGQVVGTPEYIAPEQARGLAVDGRTDIYALGVMAYEMVLGRRPFEADSVLELMQQQLSAAPPRPRTLWPEIPSPLEQLLLGMLEKDPARRPGFAEIRRVLHDLRGTPEPMELAETGPRPLSLSPRAHLPTDRVLPLARRSWMPWVAALIGVIAVGSAGGWVLWKQKRTPPTVIAPVGGGPTAPIVTPLPTPMPEAPSASQSQNQSQSQSASPSPKAANKKPPRRGTQPDPHDPDYLVDPFGGEQK
jgi:serine/threonine-protein kinase